MDQGIGHEKPAPEIFQAALAAMSVAASRTLYVGDIYSIDYLGARHLGMNAILMDIAGVYAARNLPRIERLEDLNAQLLELSENTL